MERNVPLKSQRRLVLFGLPILALILHISFCKWYFNSPQRFGRTEVRILVYGYESAQTAIAMPTNSRGRQGSQSDYIVTGLFAKRDVSKSVAILCGIVLPLVLIGCSVYLYLGWRHKLRIACGLCPECRYNLKSDDASFKNVCPECGWQRNNQHRIT